MKFIYKASTGGLAKRYLEEFSAKRGKRYQLAVRVWTNGWDRISSMFRFTEEVRKLTYTINPIESVH